jgi:hypothetical protein
VLVAEACKVWASQFKNQPAELNYNRSRNGAYTGDHPYPTVKAVTPIGDPGPPKPPAKRKDPEKK